MIARTSVALLATLSLLAGCGDRPEPEPEPQPAAQAAAPPPPPYTPEEQKAQFTPTAGLPANDKVPPGTVGDTTVGTKVYVEIKNQRMTLSKNQVTPGPVHFIFKNTDEERHILEISYKYGGRWRSVSVGKGGEVVLAQSMSPGPYEAYCYAPGHKARGEKVAFDVK
jgi:hypothetical protein